MRPRGDDIAAPADSEFPAALPPQAVEPAPMPAARPQPEALPRQELNLEPAPGPQPTVQPQPAPEAKPAPEPKPAAEPEAKPDPAPKPEAKPEPARPEDENLFEVLSGSGWRAKRKFPVTSAGGGDASGDVRPMNHTAPGAQRNVPKVSFDPAAEARRLRTTR